MDKPLYALRLAKLRNDKELTQQQLAEVTGLSRGRLNNYEQGVREPDIETLKILANFFNITTDYLLGNDIDPGKQANFDITPEDLDLLRQIKGLPPDKKDIVKAVIKVSEVSKEQAAAGE